MTNDSPIVQHNECWGGPLATTVANEKHQQRKHDWKESRQSYERSLESTGERESSLFHNFDNFLYHAAGARRERRRRKWPPNTTWPRSCFFVVDDGDIWIAGIRKSFFRGWITSGIKRTNFGWIRIRWPIDPSQPSLVIHTKATEDAKKEIKITNRFFVFFFLAQAPRS